MSDKEKSWDELLQIKTIGRDDLNADRYRYPYEPTPYSVLERLADSGLIREGDMVLDYGCGKGRASFFLSHQTKAAATGIEYDEHIYRDALENRENAVLTAKAEFVLTRAEEYELPSGINRCYFFNPFSVEILRRVMARIIDSYYENPREMLLFFYYPSDEYIAYLMTVDELNFYDEIDCRDLFEGNDRRERILIFSLDRYEAEDEIIP
ncbi:MAG: class I SAM-dependent methyltransferase [Oscillospiraceae bacterium]|nr:class I SAM-dependent methyltransferase [Oscillospiraceae bacterium]